MGDGQQRDAGVLGRLEDLAFYIDAHSAGAFIQEGVLGSGGRAQRNRLWTLLRRSVGLPPTVRISILLLEANLGPG